MQPRMHTFSHIVKDPMLIRKFVYILILSSLFFCKKDVQGTNGQIVGWNSGYCATCGGFYINFSNDTGITGSTRYALNYDASVQPLVAQFYSNFTKNHQPIPIFFDYTPVSDPPSWIHVTHLSPR